MTIRTFIMIYVVDNNSNYFSTIDIPIRNHIIHLNDRVTA